MTFELRKGKGRAIRKLFLAEGYAELGFLNRQLTLINANPTEVGIHCFKGLNRLATHIDALVNILDTELGSIDDIEGLGLLADSETDFKGRTESAINFFRKFGFDRCAKDILSKGKYAKGDRRIAISLSPSNSLNGRIEDLILKEIGESAINTCIASYDSCLEQASQTRLNSKAIAQVYISTQKSDLCGVGRAFESGILNVGHQAYANHLAMIDFVLGQ
jgi:hypothetical protein